MGGQIWIPRVVITFFFFLSLSFSKAILRTAELPSLCYVVSSIYQLFVPHFAMAVFICIYLHYRINKQRDTSFQFSSILSTVDLSKHLKCHCDEITYRHVRCPFVQKKKKKKVSFIKISPFEKWNLPSAIARNWFQLSPLFSQRQLYLWRHLPNTRLMIAWF